MSEPVNMGQTTEDLLLVGTTVAWRLHAEVYDALATEVALELPPGANTKGGTVAAMAALIACFGQTNGLAEQSVVQIVQLLYRIQQAEPGQPIELPPGDAAVAEEQRLKRLRSRRNTHLRRNR